MNDWDQHRISQLIVKKLFGTVTGKKIIILGFSFKANTNDTRESAAINICKDLLNEGALLYIHDPKVDPNQISKDLKKSENKQIKLNNSDLNEGSWCSIDDIIKNSNEADAIVILTEWEEYSQINWVELASKMRKPAWVFDSRSIISPEKIKGSNLNFWRIGDGLTN